LNLDFGLYIGL